MSAFNNTIQWYENKALDVSTLRSPTPCPRGVFCQYKIPNAETKELEIACCRMVHPGEEGNGRRLFPARTTPDGRQQPACVRLTGNAGFYERCRLKQPWRVWAAAHNISLPPTDVKWEPVILIRMMTKPRRSAVTSGGSALEYSDEYQHTPMSALDIQVCNAVSARPEGGSWPALYMPPAIIRECLAPAPCECLCASKLDEEGAMEAVD